MTNVKQKARNAREATMEDDDVNEAEDATPSFWDSRDVKGSGFKETVSRRNDIRNS